MNAKASFLLTVHLADFVSYLSKAYHERKRNQRDGTCNEDAMKKPTVPFSLFRQQSLPLRRNQLYCRRFPVTVF